MSAKPSDSRSRQGALGRGALAHGIWHAAATHPRAPVVTQFLKFGTVGVANTLLTLAVYTVLLEVLGLYYVAASGIAFTVGTVNSFLLNRRWTFREHKGDALTPVRWFAVQGSGLLVDLGLVYVLVDVVGIDTLVGQAIAIAIVVVLTFFANRAWTFRMRPSAG
jgi:putative flippase GtrA